LNSNTKRHPKLLTKIKEASLSKRCHLPPCLTSKIKGTTA
jgi:hypothetical protein